MGSQHGRAVRPLVVLAILSGMLALTAAAYPLGAEALSVLVPADVTTSVDISVRLQAGEGSGTVTLLRGSDVVGQQPSAEGTALFANVSLAPGMHSLTARLDGAEGGQWLSPAVSVYSWGAPAQPTWITPAKVRVVSPVALRAQAGASTATLTLEVNGSAVRSIACAPGQIVSLGSARLAKGANILSVIATSRTGATNSVSRSVMRYEWPYSTCIVIDKSDYRLYWVSGQQLVASYKVAHGRNNWTPVGTWKVLAKYKTDPHSVYGPRKMRMFKRVGTAGHYRYVFTRYAIHGTNNPASIGHQASHGCIRMYSSDVLRLWPQVPLGTYVVTRP